MDKEQATALPSSALAFLGDAVHSAYVRSALVSSHDLKANKLARMEIKYVCARAQAKMLESVSALLDEEEAAVVHRAQNLRTNNKPKNTPRHEYRMATAFEALLGWLYLAQKGERLSQILQYTFKEEYTA